MSIISRAPFKPHSKEWFHHYPVGKIDDDFIPRPGDIFLTHGSGFISKLIRFGQGMRYKGEDKIYSHWNHAGVVVGVNGAIVEALGKGITKRNLTDYKDTEIVIIRPITTEQSRFFMSSYAMWVSELGTRYSFMTIFFIAYGLLTGGRLTARLDGSEICSSMVAEALKSAGYYFNRKNVMPADLAYYFSVEV